jgi:hypothetical protein
LQGIVAAVDPGNDRIYFLDGGVQGTPLYAFVISTGLAAGSLILNLNLTDEFPVRALCGNGRGLVMGFCVGPPDQETGERPVSRATALPDMVLAVGGWNAGSVRIQAGRYSPKLVTSIPCSAIAPGDQNWRSTSRTPFG